MLQNPAGWVREAFPQLAAAEAAWSEDQRYEAMCVLYVALTRAKQGLYVLLPEDKKSRVEGWASPANLIRRAVAADGDGVVFQSGSELWLEDVGMRETKEQGAEGELVAAKPMRARSTQTARGPITAQPCRWMSRWTRRGPITCGCAAWLSCLSPWV